LAGDLFAQSSWYLANLDNLGSQTAEVIMDLAAGEIQQAAL